MTCEEFLERLTAFGLGELGPAEAAAAREHVTHCNPCASRALLDRQLTGLLRASVVPAPPELHDTVVAALRAEAARAGDRVRRAGRGADAGPDRRPGAGQAARPRPERQRRRGWHWGVLGLAAGLAAVVAALLLLVVPAPNPNGMLAAAWSTYRSGAPLTGGDTRQLAAVFGAAANGPDLHGLGLETTGTGARLISGHLTAVTEYRDQAGRRVALMRWKGKLPQLYGSAGQDVQTASWGGTTSAWWHEGGVVYCAIGEVDQRTLTAVADHLLAERSGTDS